MPPIRVAQTYPVLQFVLFRELAFVVATLSRRRNGSGVDCKSASSGGTGGSIPPHPGPLPKGEGESSPVGGRSTNCRYSIDLVLLFPLPGERVRVRGNSRRKLPNYSTSAIASQISGFGLRPYFGFRPSALFRVSAFGLISDFGFRTSDFTHLMRSVAATRDTPAFQPARWPGRARWYPSCRRSKRS